MRVLGIDPGTRFMGFGVVEESAGHLLHVAHGVIRTCPTARLECRLQELFAELSAAVLLHRPQCVAVEGIFHFRNARSALILGHARGVALLVAAQTGLAVHEYSPASVKRAVGAGGADGKEAVARMVRRFLGAAGLHRADASDALAVAICHLNRARIGTQLATAPPRSSGRSAAAALSDRLKPALHRFGASG